MNAMHPTPALTEFVRLEARDQFVARHVAPDDREVEAMLAAIGAPSLATLVAETVPASIRSAQPLDLASAKTEAAVLAELASLAARNKPYRSYIGLGTHGTIPPPVIRRSVLENPGWYTAYTPYQAEIAQGRLEALLNWQTMVADLTGLPVANASLLDEATAAAEAMTMARGAAAKSASDVLVVASDVHPHTLAVVRTRARWAGIEVRVVDPGDLDAIRAAKPFGILLQNPSTTGAIRDLTEEIAAGRSAGGLAIVATDLLALTLITPPGEQGADIAVGSAQRFGVPPMWGGPAAAFLATRDALKRQIPGRLVGVSIDAAGRPALRLALQTREQHIRREKATSNICTAQVLLAVIAGFYAAWHGPEGLTRIARRVNLGARILAEAARAVGLAPRHRFFFDTVTLHAGGRADALMQAALDRGINLRRVDATGVAISLDETVTEADLRDLLAVLSEAAHASVPPHLATAAESIPSSIQRTSRFLTHPAFTSHRSEHGMLRWLKSLEDKDIALNRSMIPLGSCTMKLNAAAEMLPITWDGFASIHPFAPIDQAEGWLALVRKLETDLARVTGFAAVSLQPNAGSQGEYAGLLAIRAYQEARGEGHRDICLIPASAHGTNPASAVMAGLKVVVVGTDRSGNIDLADLKAKAEAHRDRLAALMITYPSTHGVFEEGVRDACALIHEAGGQVYMDGANMNAQVGLTSPAAIGADVCHLNLHKTFCIPHGGGGPGVGPIGVAAHLAPYLPNHPMLPEAGPVTGCGPISAHPFGSAGILPIPYAYIAMMGGQGLTRATEIAILSANYIAHRLKDHFPVLYVGSNGRVAHECVLDCRSFQGTAGVTVEDIAKRLQDYGFHAPTMSWPVPGTLMVEPTESEPKAEIDRFIDAMIGIRNEIRQVEQGAWPKDDNPLKHAPHTAGEVLASDWTHAYSRETAAFPRPWVAARKYWPPVKRVDNVHGDRNLVCSCPPLSEYAEAAE